MRFPDTFTNNYRNYIIFSVTWTDQIVIFDYFMGEVDFEKKIFNPIYGFFVNIHNDNHDPDYSDF